MNLIRVDILLILVSVSATTRQIASKQIHVVLVYARGVISDLAGNVRRVPLRLDESPSEIALHGGASRLFQLVAVELAEALQA